MEDSKKEVNKPKRSRTEHVKNVVTSYLQKRNYSVGSLENMKKDQQLTYSLIENETCKPNSILYSCYNSDPNVIDHNFGKFLSWVKDLVKNKNMCHDIEHLVGPLFCHLYLDILKGGHSERAATFFKAHLPAIDKTKCDDFVKDLINLFADDSDATCLEEQYRSNKYFLELSPDTVAVLKTFVAENCHVVFLHVLQTWFDLHENTNGKEYDSDGEGAENIDQNGHCMLEDKFQNIIDTIQELEKEPKQVYVLNVSNTKESVTCGMIRRACGLVAYSQNSAVHLRPIHSFDSIVGHNGLTEITLQNHTKQIYCISISPDQSALVTASADCNLCIYSLDEIKLVQVCTGHLGPVYSVTVSSNSMYAASASHDTTARLWDLKSGRTLRIFAGHTQAVTCVDFHPNCLYLATGSADKNIRLWSVDNGNPLRLFHGSKGIVYAIAFNPLGESLASVSDDKRVRIWDVLNSKNSVEIKHKGEPITKVAWSHDGKELCTGSVGKIVRIWNLGGASENPSDLKNQEPAVSFNVVGKILDLEYSFDTFACVNG